MKIKRILTLVLALAMIFSLAACGEDAPETVRVQTLNGTTGFGMAKMINDHAQKTDYTFTVQTDASLVLGALTSGEADIAALPTNAAAKLYNDTNGAIEILAVNTLGCLYLLNASGTAITSISELEGKTVYTPSQNPSFIFKHICTKNNLNVNIVSNMTPQDLSAAMIKGDVEYAVLPEPLATATIGQAKTGPKQLTVTKDLDLTAEWDKIAPAGSLVQGCVVVRKAFLEEYPETVANFLTEYKASIEFLNNNVDEAAQMIETANIGKAAAAKKAIPFCNVRYVDGDTMITAMKAYLEILHGIAPQSVGGKLPDDSFYYKAS